MSSQSRSHSGRVVGSDEAAGLRHGQNAGVPRGRNHDRRERKREAGRSREQAPAKRSRRGDAHAHQPQRDKGEEQTSRGAGKSNDGCLYRRIEERLEQGCAANSQERLLTHAAVASGPGNSGGDQGGEHDARGAEEEEQHLGVERVVSHPVEPRGEIVRERRASGRSRLDVVRHLTHRLIRADGVRGQAGAVEKDVELGANCFRLRGSLRIEDGAPCRHREDKDVVGRRLGRESGGRADSLKQRVDVRDRRDAGHPHGRRRKTGPIDADLVADPRVQVRGRLAVQNRSIEAAAQKRDLVGKSREIIGRECRSPGRGRSLAAYRRLWRRSRRPWRTRPVGPALRRRPGPAPSRPLSGRSPGPARPASRPARWRWREPSWCGTPK